MPVRSLNSPVLKWPDAATVDQAVRAWAQALAARRTDVLAIGYIGSYARGDWGVGSDLDIIIVLRDSPLPLAERARQFDATQLPVPADVLVYTEREFTSLLEADTRFARALQREIVWLHPVEGKREPLIRKKQSKDAA